MNMERVTQEILCTLATGFIVTYNISTSVLSISNDNISIPYDNMPHESYIDSDNVFNFTNYLENIGFYNEMIEDGLRRYELVNKTEYQMIDQCDDFLKMLFNNFPFTETLLSFRNDSVKAVIKLNGKSFSLRKSFDCADILFVSTFVNKGDSEILEVFEFEIQDYNSIRNFIDA